MTFLGFKVIISFTCLCAFIFQSILLIEDFNKKMTVTTNTDIFMSGDILTPDIIICGDPPNRNLNEKLVWIPEGQTQFEHPHIRTMNTIFKGVCTLIETGIMKTDHDLSLRLSFNLTKKLNMFVLFPGQKLFVANYHPIKSMDLKEINGNAVFSMKILITLIGKLPEKSNCQIVRTSLPEVAQAHKNYESW